MAEFLLGTRHDLSNLFNENGENRYGKTVVIQSTDKKNFMGILVEDSIVIPLRVNQPAEDSIQNMVNINISELAASPNKNLAEEMAHKLGLPYNGHTMRLYSDGQVFKGVLALHLYFYEHIESEEASFQKMSEILDTRGVKISLLKN